MYDVYFSKQAISDFEAHSLQFSKNRLECMGLLLGNFFSFKGRKWVFAEEYITSGNDSSAVSVRFSRASFSSLVEKYNSSSRLVVGWAHSHPGYGCFLSATDVRTQQSFFSNPLNFALVADPSRKSPFGRQLKKVFRVEGNSPFEISFAVVEPSGQGSHMSQ